MFSLIYLSFYDLIATTAPSPVLTPLPSKDKALYKACGSAQGEGRQCNKKVVENGDGTYR